ncbi:hypothetical protein TNCT_454961 [Trichonephila clavata]|uniref:Uncharacterized protein n=1 Tax=Trichonephila clavata TaxID=2740835 RepID=A0A8X6LFY4_TRICU|nr:hypothetical protein TNCT_454961 [Trichonephila clavata]
MISSSSDLFLVIEHIKYKLSTPTHSEFHPSFIETDYTSINRGNCIRVRPWMIFGGNEPFSTFQSRSIAVLNEIGHTLLRYIVDTEC